MGHGYTPTHKLLAVAALYCRARRSGDRRVVLVVTPGPARADDMYRRLAALLPGAAVHLFPATEVWPHEPLHIGESIHEARLATLETLTARGPALVVVPVQALAERLPPRSSVEARTLDLAPGRELPLSDLAERLAAAGYERVDMVQDRRQFSVRGGLVDVFPPAAMAPIRIDYFDDEIDSIRAFDVDTQRSTETLDEVRIGPAREWAPGADEESLARLRQAFEEQITRLRQSGSEEGAANLAGLAEAHLDHLQSRRWAPGLEQYKPYLFGDLPTLLDYAPEALVVVDEPARSKEQLDLHLEEFHSAVAGALERGRTLPGALDMMADWDALVGQMRTASVLLLAGLEKGAPGFGTVAETEVASKLPETFHSKMDRFVAAVQRARRDGTRVVIAVSTVRRAEGIVELLRAEEIPVRPYRMVPKDVVSAASANGEGTAGGAASAPDPRTVLITEADLGAGCQLPGDNLLLLTEFEIFGRQRQARSTRGGRRSAGTQLDPADLKVGDYVVHVNHGIGQYKGVETLVVTGIHKDYLLVQYQGDDKLYVPTDQVGLLQKYMGVEGQAPRLSKLGGNEWNRAKQRVRESVREIAQGLLKLYAERDALPGYAFTAEHPWQRQFEDSFAYEETPDQLRAVEEIKADMERPRPMDRLLCGDVGFGKTEVAMRAAFKAAVDARQVAVLVPTTILAQQHLRTFRERFEEYPMRIESLSRFQSASEQQRIIKDVAAGAVDVVIGTHRLLSKDVSFKDLGLVIVDEEQRFGVAQKERLKELRRTVDVLTLSATPIPRTLHMAMVGVRDMSVIETPPEDRFPIRTYVAEADDELFRSAIVRELDRGGQVYFVHNRVQGIERFAAELQKLVPEARIAVAHGQMNEDALERVMLDFLEHEIDVLLCSTIIETGMDIANVNTLIVDEADRLGLAQLYQLRGRVGRSNRVAYAYFTHRRDKILSEDAEKRLHAIKEFTELGSGFKIALRDLEIRGTGNLLGPEQHGFIASVGFELYCKLLEDAVRAVKGEVVEERPDPAIDLNVDAYVPDGYVAEARRKVEIYKKVAAVRTAEDAAELRDELEDRFGPAPPPVHNLLAVARMKVWAAKARVASVNGSGDEIAIRLEQGAQLTPDTALRLGRRFRGRVLVSAAPRSPIRLKTRGMGQRDVVATLEQVLAEMAGATEDASTKQSTLRKGASYG